MRDTRRSSKLCWDFIRRLLGGPLLYPVCPRTRTKASAIVDLRHVEVACRIRREGRGVGDLAGSIAIRGEHRPIPLGIPLLDLAIGDGSAHDVQVAPAIHR